ncbi:MAG: hypothetical protein ABSC03_06605 [Verrucomicrobiota bacterium]|jgi:beta-galactosidase
MKWSRVKPGRISSPVFLFTLAMLAWLVVASLAARAAAPFVWIEGEKPTSLNAKPAMEGTGNPQFLSATNWLKISIEEGDVEKAVPGDGVLASYAFKADSAGDYAVWARIGYEFARSPFEWRVDDSTWTKVSPDELTTDLMELSFWTEIAWLKLGDTRLAAGEHTLKFRLNKEKNNGKWRRILFALDCVCLSADEFHPYSHFKPGEDHRTEADRAAATHVFQLPEAVANSARNALKLAGTWEVCRHDEQMPGEVAAPITNFPAPPRWTAIEVPGNKNDRADLVFAHRLWYRTRVNVPASQTGRSFHLVFPENNLNTTVFVNGRFCGFDKNPFARVQIDVTQGIKPGVNEIWVGIKDAWYGHTADPTNPRKLRGTFNLPVKFFSDGFQDLAYPIWNHPQSGILLAPELVAAGPVYASDVFVKPSVARKELAVEITLANPTTTAAAGELRWEAVAPDGQVAKTFAPVRFELPAAATKKLELSAAWPDARLWWPDEPNLYTLRTVVHPGGGRADDMAETTFGFREWTADGPDFRLNGIKWHGWADTFTADSPDEWLRFYHLSQQRMMRFWGRRWMGLSPEDALGFFDRNGVVVRRSGMLDGEAIGYFAVENDGGLKRRRGSEIKIDLMTNWLDQVVAQVKGERNHPSVNVWSIENEWLYINCINLYGGLMDEFERWEKQVSDTVRAADPTRFTMSDGGGANKDNSLPVHGSHYVFNSDAPEQYPTLAYDANVTGGGRGRWVWDQRRPRFLGEDYFANGINPFDYAYFGGEATFQGKAQARPAAGVIYRMLTQGYRWAGYAAWHFWMSQNEATDQYAPNAPRAAFVREWDWTFGSSQQVPRTIGLFNDTRFDDPMTFIWTLIVDGKELATQTGEHRVPPGENEKFALTLPMPAVKARTEGELRLALRVKGQEVFRDTKPLSVLGIGPAPRRDLALAVFDPQQKLAALLQARHIVFTAVTNLASLPGTARLLLVGPDALSAGEAGSSRLAAWASAGRRVIVLDQTHPLKFQGLPCEMNAEQNTGRTAFIEDPDHPAVRGLKDRDFFTWGGDEIVYRNAYEKPTRGAKSLIQCHRRLKNSALVEVPVGNGLMLLSQLDLGAKLATNAVAQTLLLNLLDYAAGYQLEFRPVAAAVADSPLLAQTVEAIGLANTAAADARAALAMPKAKILLIHASPANLKQLADSAAPVTGFLNAGGFIVLNGLTPEGLADYNRLVGFEHLIRPFWRERVALASPRHPLTAGLSTGDVVFRSGERIFGWTSDEFVADDVFSYVVDYRDVAPFARFEDDFKKLMVNGMVNADAWKYIVNLPVEQCVFKLVWPKPQTFESLTWIGNKNYFLARQAEFQFDGGQKAMFDFAPNDEPQEFDLKPPRPAREIVFKITKWDEKPDTHALSGLDNIYLYAQRPPEFLATVKPLLNIGGLMFYQRGAGGILLANLRFKATEAVPENAVKKRAILATLLRNLKAPFSGARTVIAGANLRYEPVDLSKQCTQFRNEKGWFGDPKFTFAGLPSGRQTFAGVPFNLFEFETSPVPNAIMLGGDGVPNNPPKEVKGIAVGRKADALFFLLAARMDHRMNDDDRRNNRRFETARFVVTYADGQTAEIPILAEVDVDHYRQKEPRPLPGAQIAWTRPYAGTDETAVAYLKPWANPRPGVEIKSLDFVYGKEPRGVPALLALTAALAE